MEAPGDLTFRQGRSVGAVACLHAVAGRLGIGKALGPAFEGKLALWQVLARTLDQGSRLSAVRLARTHEAAGILGLKRGFDEDDLYANLGWLEERQEALEQALVRFRCAKVPFVGDRGMIKTPQQTELAEAGFAFITALTRPQIRTLLAERTLQLGRFDEHIREDEAGGKRYVLHRNPVRAEELAATRRDKQARMEALAQKETQYVTEHPRAKSATALKRLQARIKTLAVSGWLTMEVEDHCLTVRVDEAARNQEAELARISHQIRYQALQNLSDARSGSPFFEACFPTR